MKKINYLAAAFLMTLSLAVSSCSKNDDEDASMLPPSSTANTQAVAATPASNVQDDNSGESLENSSACKCPGPNVGPVDTMSID